MKFIIGKKIEMTQLWKDDKVFGVTKIQAGPCTVSQIKVKEKDGYQAVQLGFGERKAKNIARPQAGHFKKSGKNFSAVKEFRLDKRGKEDKTALNVGDVINVETFSAGDIVNVIGVSKGKGFQGVVKRHNFAGGRKTHGNKDQLRMPGSISATGVGHVFKGTRMAGRMGGDRLTVKNMQIVEVDPLNNFIYISGAVPGSRNSLVMIEGLGELKIVKPEIKSEKTEEPKTEEAAIAEPKAEETKTEEANTEENPKV